MYGEDLLEEPLAGEPLAGEPLTRGPLGEPLTTEHSDAPPSPPDPVELQAELDRLLRENSELNRDFRNYKRHAEARLARAHEQATADLLGELGESLRNLELALEAKETQDPRALRQGVAQVARGIQAVFERHGVHRIPTEGTPFDPALHEAALVEHREDVARGTVLRELSPGFRTAERVVLPAKVAVSA